LSYKSVDPENRPYAYEIKYPFIVGGVSPEVRERLNVQFKHRAQHSISSGSYKMKFSEVKDDIFEVNEQYESYGITNIPRAAPDKVADFNWWFSTKDGRACEIEECFLGLNELKSSAFSFTDSMDLKSARSENAKRKDSAHDVASSCDGDLSVSLVSIKKGEVLIRLRKYEFPDNECDRSVVMSLEKVRKFFMEDQILEAFIKAK
jgi:hypothetical protein